MKINVTYTDQHVIDLIQRDIINKIGVEVDRKDIILLVQSTQNYREKTWEIGKLKFDIEVDVK